MKASLYRILERPLVYALAQQLLAPGADRIITGRIGDILADVPAGEPLLDIGCGPASWLSRVGLAPVGLDINPAYVAAYRNCGSPGVVASAVELPFGDHTFAGVWSIGLLHHLDNDQVKAILSETIRVTRPGGYVAILDAVTPAPGKRPFAAMIRRWDRGRHMRSEGEFLALLPPSAQWTCGRFTATTTGLEMLSCVCTKAKT